MVLRRWVNKELSFESISLAWTEMTTTNDNNTKKSGFSLQTCIHILSSTQYEVSFIPNSLHYSDFAQNDANNNSRTIVRIYCLKMTKLKMENPLRNAFDMMSKQRLNSSFWDNLYIWYVLMSTNKFCVTVLLVTFLWWFCAPANGENAVHVCVLLSDFDEWNQILILRKWRNTPKKGRFIQAVIPYKWCRSFSCAHLTNNNRNRTKRSSHSVFFIFIFFRTIHHVANSMYDQFMRARYMM